MTYIAYDLHSVCSERADEDEKDTWHKDDDGQYEGNPATAPIVFTAVQEAYFLSEERARQAKEEKRRAREERRRARATAENAASSPAPTL